MEVCATLQLIAIAVVFGIDSILEFFVSPSRCPFIQLKWICEAKRMRRHIVQKVTRI